MFDTIARVFKVELFRGFNGFYGIARGSLRGRGSPRTEKYTGAPYNVRRIMQLRIRTRKNQP